MNVMKLRKILTRALAAADAASLRHLDRNKPWSERFLSFEEEGLVDVSADIRAALAELSSPEQRLREAGQDIIDLAAAHADGAVKDAVARCAAALGIGPETFEPLAVKLVAEAGPAAFLALLREHDRETWRERMLAVFRIEDGNACGVARRIGLSRRAVALMLAEDAELAAAVAVQWPGRQRNSR